MTKHAHAGRSAFTLVEMLVSVAIVSLMMVMFAQIFSLAGGSVSSQKGVARNDQRARVIVNMLRNDLATRTFRTLVPFGDDEPDPNDGGKLDFNENRRGFFYYSENDPANQTDDVLQFTIQVSDSDLEYGRAESNFEVDGVSGDPDLPGDDLVPGNGTGSSQYAVVTYFLRYGTLYRRVMLIRQPWDGQDAPPPPYGGTTFWRHYDYSAHYDAPTSAVVWHGKGSTNDWLANDGPDELNTLGNPTVRFGHHSVNGRPREFDNSGNFIGRYTHEETSSPDFTWPANDDVEPFNPDESPATIVDGFVTEYPDGTRRGQDILMQNVHAFDVKLFDGGTQDFVDVGSGTGDFAQTNNANDTYSPDDPPGHYGYNIFDTWHPKLGEPPPYRPADVNGPKPVRAIQITIRYLDVASGQMRQVTLRHAMFRP